MTFLTAPLIYVFCTVFFQGFGNSLAIPVLPYISTELNGTSFHTGIMFSGYYIGMLLSMPLLEIDSIPPRTGRKPMLLLAAFGQGISNIILYFSTDIWFFVVVRILGGCFAGIYSIGQACVADLTSIKTRSQCLSIVDGVLSSGYIVGSFLAGVLTNISIRTPIMTSGGVFLFTCLFVIVLYKESSPIAKQKKEIKNKIKNYKKEGKLAEAKEKEELLKHFYKTRSTDGDASKLKCNIFIVVSLITQFVNLYLYSAFESMYGIYGEQKHDLTAQVFSYLTSAYSLINAIQQIFCYSPIINKLHISIPILSVISSVIEAIGLLMTAYGSTLLISVLGILATSFGFGFISPAASSIISSECPPHLQGFGMGLVVIAGQLGATVASLSTSWFMSIEQDLGFSHQVVLTLFIFVGMLVVYFQPGGAYVGLEQRRPPDLETIKDIKTEEKIDELNNEDMNSQLATKESVELDDNTTLGTTLKGDDQQDETNENPQGSSSTFTEQIVINPLANLMDNDNQNDNIEMIIMNPTKKESSTYTLD